MDLMEWKGRGGLAESRLSHKMTAWVQVLLHLALHIPAPGALLELLQVMTAPDLRTEEAHYFHVASASVLDSFVYAVRSAATYRRVPGTSLKFSPQLQGVTDHSDYACPSPDHGKEQREWEDHTCEARVPPECIRGWLVRPRGRG